jgi:hypothetical protein
MKTIPKEAKTVPFGVLKNGAVFRCLNNCLLMKVRPFVSVENETVFNCVYLTDGAHAHCSDNSEASVVDGAFVEGAE